MSSHKIVFFGTSDFAVPILRRLAKDARFELLAVITQPDRPVGRKAVLTSPPIKETAVALDIPVYQYENVKSEEAFEELKKLSADFYAVASFGQIIPQRILDIPKLGAINVHASLPEISRCFTYRRGPSGRRKRNRRFHYAYGCKNGSWRRFSECC